MKIKLFLALIAMAGFLAPQALAADAKADAKIEQKSEKKEKGKGEKKASDADVLKENSAALTKALQAGEVEKVLGFFADDFSAPMIKDKETLKALIEMGANSGTFSGLTTDESKTKYAIDGDKATVGPWDFSTGGDSGTATFTCVKKDGTWKIKSLDITGVSF